MARPVSFPNQPPLETIVEISKSVLQQGLDKVLRHPKIRAQPRSCENVAIHLCIATSLCTTLDAILTRQIICRSPYHRGAACPLVW